MDPATFGLLFSIAPTVLDLLFGEGHIKKSLHPQRYSSKNMLAYGLEGYGEGYRYPPRVRHLRFYLFKQNAVSFKKLFQYLPRNGLLLIFLNKRAVANNEWFKS
jgi:hypothetical protein